jgi:hypothetical protein
MNKIKTWQQRQAETGIGSVEAKDDEIRELRQAIEQAGKATPEHDALIAEMRVTAPIWEGYVGDMLRSAADKLEAYALAAPQMWTSAEQEVHDALCPALTGGKCSCSSSPATVDKAWSQFCGGIGRGPDAPYPGMIQAFEAHYGQSFTDKDWRNETGIWAAAWGYAVRRCNATPTAPAQSLEQIVKDSILYGTGVSLGGKRIHPNDIYTAPAQPLTEQRIHKIWRSLAEGEGLDEFARAIEAAHGIKGASL